MLWKNMHEFQNFLYETSRKRFSLFDNYYVLLCDIQICLLLLYAKFRSRILNRFKTYYDWHIGYTCFYKNSALILDPMQKSAVCNCIPYAAVNKTLGSNRCYQGFIDAVYVCAYM